MPKPEVNTKTIVTMALVSVLGLNTARTVSQSGGASGASSSSTGVRTTDSALAPPTAESYREKLSGMVAGAQRPLSFLVATVPDPDQTGLRIYTDRALDGIQLAAFHRKYVLMKHWVPWKTGPDRLDDTYSSRRAQAQENSTKAQFPGMLVFEDSVADGSMVVMLVPDTPTSGVNIPVLEEALRLLTDSDGQPYPKGTNDPGCKVTLVGPSFSGGLHGLDDLIAGGKGGCISRVITGPATGISPAFLQGLGAGHPDPAGKNAPRAAGNVPLNWVRAQQSESRRAVDDYLFAQRELGIGLISRDRVVRLVEDATGFAIAMSDGVAQGKANVFTDPDTKKSHVFAIEQTGRPFEPGRVLSIDLDGTEKEVSKVIAAQELILKDAQPSMGEVPYEFNPRGSPTYSHFGTALLSADGQTLTAVRHQLGNGFNRWMRGQRMRINYSSCKVTEVESHAKLKLGDCDNPPVRTLLKVSDSPPDWRQGVNYAIDCRAVNDRACTPEDVSFPWQISRIRNAAPDLADSKERSASAPSVFSLPLQLRDTRREEGSVPMFAASQTPTAQEAVLAQIAARIERQRPDFVSIIATDVMDSLFLVKLLRANNPDQRLLLVDPDLLFLRAQEMISATGVMAATTLPNSTHLLISGVTHFNFDSEYQASVYLAARKAMEDLTPKEKGANSAKGNAVSGPTSKRLELGWFGVAIPPCEMIPLLTVIPPCTPPSPPLWLVALGKDGYWPIAQLRVPPPSGDPRMAPQKMPLMERPTAGEDSAEQSGWRRLEWHRPTLLWFSSFLVASVSCLAWLVLLCWARWTKNNFLEDLDIHSRWDGWVTRAVTISALSVAIAIYYVVRSLPAWMPQRHPMSDIDFPMAGAFWIGLAALTAAAVVPWWGRTPFNKRHLVSAIACATPMLSALGVVLTVRRADDEFHYWMFFLRRSQDYLNGINPLLPLELLGLGLIGFAWASHMGGIIRTERFICLGALTPHRACTQDSPAQPHKAVWGPLAGTWGKCLLAVCVTVCVTLACWFVLFRNFHSLETMKYDLWFTLAAAALAVWTFLEGLWFVGDWKSVRGFLDWLELHPIRFVAADLPKEKDEGAIWEPNPRRRSYLFYARSAECLERLARELPESPKPEDAAGQPPVLTRSYVLGIAQKIRQFLADRGTGDGEFRGTIETPLAELAKVFERELEDVDGRWKRGASELERAAKEKEMAKAGTSLPIDAGRLMEEFLAVRLAAYLRSIFLLIRNRLTAMTAGFVAITLSLSCYPFGRERVLQAITLLLAALLGAMVLKVFTEMQHSPMLARFSGADGGQMSSGFLAKLLSAAALPLLSLLASYTPAINQLVGGWLQPALTSLAK